MKKSIFLLAAGAMALTACTQSEVIEEGVQSNAIGFQSSVGNATRLDGTTLSSFNVYGYYTKSGFEANPVTVFDGQNVTGSGSSWTYSPARYWIPGATYYFYAYSCGNNALTDNGKPSMSFDEDGNVSVGISNYICNDSHQDDLIFACNDEGDIVGKQDGNSKVPFNFTHILSKVKVKFVSQFAAGYDLKISNVKLANVYGQGNYNPLVEDVWTATGAQNVTVSLKNGSNMTASAKDGDNPAKDAITSETYVIPHEYLNNVVTISFRVDITNGGADVMSRVFTGTWKPNWVNGYAYTYTINISGETASLDKIDFGDMNVGSWEATDGPALTFGVTTPTN